MGSNAVFLSPKCLPLTSLQGCFGGKLVWHRIFYHTTTTKPLHPNWKKHICKKLPVQKPPAHATMSNELPSYASAHTGNQAYDDYFFALKELTENDIFPPPVRCPTCNGAPPKSRTTKTQQDKERKSALAAKALAATEKELTCDAKKRASEGLKEKKKQLLASCKAKRKAIKAAALQKKATPLTLSTPGRAGGGCNQSDSPSSGCGSLGYHTNAALNGGGGFLHSCTLLSSTGS